MDDHRKLAREKRKQRRFEKLGTNTPQCVKCGCDKWECLEQHHIAGQAYDDTTVILCANCHREMTELQNDDPPHDPLADSFLERVGRFLRGLAHMLRPILDLLEQFGLELISRASSPIANFGGTS